MHPTLRFILIFLLQVFLLAGIGACDSKYRPEHVPADNSVQDTDTTAAIVLEVSQCARLYTSEFIIHKIVTYSDEPVMKGHFLGIPIEMNTRIGERKVAVPLDVTLKGYIDFSTFHASQVERTDQQITLTLPDPQIMATASKVDHQGTRQFIDLTRSRFTDAEITKLTKQGTEEILSHISQYGIVEQTRISATRILVPLLTRLGYAEEQITIRFRKEFNDQELFKIVQKQ